MLLCTAWLYLCFSLTRAQTANDTFVSLCCMQVTIEYKQSQQTVAGLTEAIHAQNYETHVLDESITHEPT